MRWLLLAVAAPALAQGLRFGVKAGVPLTAYFETRHPGVPFLRPLIVGHLFDYSSATRRYTFGPSVEYALAGPLGLELDVLFKRMGYAGAVQIIDSANGVVATSFFDTKGDSWDIPLLAKYRFWHFYLVGGPVVRYVGPVRARGEETVSRPTQSGRTTTVTPIDTSEPSDLRKRLYANINGPLGPLRFAPDQAEFLLGLLF